MKNEPRTAPPILTLLFLFLFASLASTDDESRKNRAARMAFFRSQLKDFLILAREQSVDPLSLTGSYAGAMGIPQFMPESYRKYAVDFNGDGRVDIVVAGHQEVGVLENRGAGAAADR